MKKFDVTGRSRHLVLLCLAAVLTVAACSSDDTPSAGALEDPSLHPIQNSQSATEICDSTLSVLAAESLEAISGQSTFAGMEGRPPTQLDEFADSLMSSDLFRAEEFCWIYTPAHWSNPFARVEFRWGNTEPTPEIPAGGVAYAAGEAAYIQNDGAVIRFPCATGKDTQPGQVLDAYMYTQVPSDGDHVMAILNSISRAVAGELGCLEESALPEGAPDPLAQ